MLIPSMVRQAQHSSLLSPSAKGGLGGISWCPIIQALLVWPCLAGADDIDALLQRNMRVYAHVPSATASQGLRTASEPPAINQAEMVVYDNRGRTRSRQRVALGPIPPPPSSSSDEKPLTEYPRKPGPPKPKYEIDYTFSSGYREDRLNWNIAASNLPPYYYGHPNVLSELKWENINVAQIGGKAEITSPGGWHFQGKVDYGFVTGGENQDSDYLGNNRTAEFSRSNNAADSGHMLDVSMGAGYRFALRDDEASVRVSATPMAGYSYHEQNLTASKLVQTIPPLGYHPGLDSRYSTQWHGPWLGLQATALPFDWLDLFGQFEYHWANYYGKANWNLRADFQHPISFRHDANGEGIMTNAGMRFRLTPAWALELSAFYTTMQTDQGLDTTYFSSGTVGTTRLNRVQWDSWGGNAGVRYRY